MRRLRRLFLLLLLLGWIRVGAQASTRDNTLVLPGLGQATAKLDGPWAFHVGDDPRWAAPGFDDAGWERISTEKPWGAQGHFAQVGFGWYRQSIDTGTAGSSPMELALLVPFAEDAYQVYWNGREVGQVGKLPPHASWPAYPAAHSFPLGRERTGVLAIRVWKAPAVSFDSGFSGGLTGVPVLGSAEAIASLDADGRYLALKQLQFAYGLALVYLLVGIASLGIWLRRREQSLLLWLGVFSLASVLQFGWWHGVLGMSYAGEVLLATLYQSAMDISTWFLLLHLLHLRGSARVMRWTRWLAWSEICLLCVDAAAVSARVWAVGWPQLVDGVISELILIPELFPVVLVGLALRKRLPVTTWLVAAFVLATDLNLELGSFLSQGDRYTHWTFWQTMIRPLFTVDGTGISLQQVCATLLLVSLVVAVYQQLVREGEQQVAMTRELHSAQELQRVLIPEELPSVLGYEVTSAYRPAQEVGGDFFQLIPQGGGSALLIVGDVSGKGLTAAMAVALIIGAIRTAAEQLPSPAEMLGSLNRRLQGRLNGGFATCVVLRLEANGNMFLASAGHPAPFLNGVEIPLPAALPLGISLDAEFEEAEGHLVTGDHLTLYSDGLLEARNAHGELYGFERLQQLAATRPNASAAADAAIAFGQDDDITVVTVTRLRVGAASRTSLVAPELVTRPASA